MRQCTHFCDLLRMGPLLALVVISVDCGPGGPVIGSISGTVTHGGEPVSPGLVNFASKSGFAVSAQLERNGTYTARSQHGKGIPVGTYQVSLSDAPMSDREVIEALRGKSVTAAPHADLVKIPAKYRDYGTSGLTIEVREGDNVFDIDLDPVTKPGT